MDEQKDLGSQSDMNLWERESRWLFDEEQERPTVEGMLEFGSDGKDWA